VCAPARQGEQPAQALRNGRVATDPHRPGWRQARSLWAEPRPIPWPRPFSAFRPMPPIIPPGAAGIGKVQQAGSGPALLVHPAPHLARSPGASSNSSSCNREFQGQPGIGVAIMCEGMVLQGRPQKRALDCRFTIRSAAGASWGSRRRIHLARLTVSTAPSRSQHHPMPIEPKSLHQGRSLRKTTCFSAACTRGCDQGHPHGISTPPATKQPDQPRCRGGEGW